MINFCPFFSGLKTFHELNEAFPSLIDEKGNRKPFERFLNDVRKIDDTYNRNYLRAEYNFASASAEMAARWEQFLEDGDRYFLQYRTASDDKVRPEHAALHGVTLPIDDPFWEQFTPPNGWNCRCTVVQVRKSKYPMSDPELAMRRGQNCTAGAKRQIFRFNPGKAMRIFPDRHPYLPKNCGDCDKRLNLAFNPGSIKCAVCDEVRRQARIKQNGEIYKQLLKDHDYHDVEFNEATGALKATHVGHKKHLNDKVRYFEEGLTGDDLEDEFMDLAFNREHSVIFNNESKKDANGNQLTSLDMTFDGVVMDVKSITKLKDHYGAALISKNKQLHRYNHRSDVTIKADTVCLYFHDETMFSESRILDGVNYMSKNSKSVAIKHIICAVKTNDGLKLFNFNI